MKILMINNTYEQLGGTETYILNISNSLIEKGHKVYHFAIDEKTNIINKELFIYHDKYKRGIYKYFYGHFFNPFLFFRFKMVKGN